MQPYGPAILRLIVGAVFLAHGAQIADRDVYATAWPHADRFVVRIVGGRCVITPSVDAFLASGDAGPLDAVSTVSRGGCPRRRPFSGGCPRYLAR